MPSVRRAQVGTVFIAEFVLVVLHWIGRDLQGYFAKMNWARPHLHDAFGVDWIGGLGGFAPHMKAIAPRRNIVNGNCTGYS